jgi:haloalkane dehalogenase
VAAGAASGDPVMFVHGFPESSRMWVPLMRALSETGRRCVAPDLFCLGDSDDPGPATFERNLDSLAALHAELGFGRVALVVHDWGGFVGLAWACDHPDQVSALVISDTGFFSDGRWHGMAEAIRGEQGEALVSALDRDGFAALLRADGAPLGDADVDAYWRPFAEGRGRQATLEFYRSMDFAKLEPYEGRLAELGVPTLLLWGAEDEFAPIGGAHRLAKQIPGAKLVAIEGAGHFVYDQERGATTAAVAEFLADAQERPDRGAV